MRTGYLIKSGVKLTGKNTNHNSGFRNSNAMVPVEICNLEEIWPVTVDDCLREAGFHAEERRYS